MKSEKKRIQACLKRNDDDIEFQSMKARALFASLTAIATLKSDETRNPEDVAALIGDQYETENNLATLNEMFSQVMNKIEQGHVSMVVKHQHEKTA